MDADEVTTALAGIVTAERVRADAPLAPLTTFGVGGPADWLVDIRSLNELSRVLACAKTFDVPMTVLGGGSNVLVADAGVRGIVVRLRMTGVERTGPDRVRADAGLTINGLVRWMVGRGLSGLEAWAGTPGTVGGAIHGNAHYGGRDISEHTLCVALLTPTGQFLEVPADQMGFGYDTSRLFHTREIVVWAEFKAGDGAPESLRAVARESLAHRKRTQPLQWPSAGCVFQNPLPGRDQVPDGIPWSAGALVDRAGFKGARVGGASVSCVHANFVVTEPGATAADVRRLIEDARRAVFDQFGVELREEIVYLGDV